MSEVATDVSAVGAAAAAEELGVHALLNCYVREAPGWCLEERADGAPTLVVPVAGGRLEVALAHRSPTLRHRYHLPVELVDGGGGRRALDLAQVAGALTGQLLGDPTRPSGGERAAPATAPDVLLARVLDSAATTADALAARAGEVGDLWGPAPLGFLRGEQALLVGHQVHPTPKSRSEMSAEDRARYLPERAGAFPLHWFAVDPSVLHHDSATGTPAPELARALLAGDPEVDPATLAGLAQGGAALLPAHPWEAEHLLARPALAPLFERGLVRPLGPLGSPWSPTTSVRTVHHPDQPWMLKFSLDVRLTNYLRVTLPKELGRAVEAARLWSGPVGARAAEVAPHFTALLDPAFLAVRWEGEVVDGFSVLLRQNRWPGRAGVPLADGAGLPADDVAAVTTLCQDHPFGAPPAGTGGAVANRLGAIVADLAHREGVPVREAGRAWFDRFAEVAVSSLVRLYLDVGLCFEAHAQNTLLELRAGWPVRCVYRDSQGYFHRQAAHDDLCRVVPGLGEATESIFPEDLADERLTYYLFVNMALSVVNALGVAGVADEAVLLADLRGRLEAERAAGGRYPATLLDVLLDQPRWPCKGNLRTRFHDMDELVGDIATQSVYVTIPNPLAVAP